MNVLHNHELPHHIFQRYLYSYPIGWLYCSTGTHLPETTSNRNRIGFM